MPQVSGYTSIPAGTTVNVMSGQLNEHIGGRGAYVKLYGVNATSDIGDMLVTMILGSDVVAQNRTPAMVTTGFKVPDDQLAAGPGLPSDQIVVNVANANVGALVFHWMVDIENA